MLTREQVISRKDVQEAIKSCGSIFSKVDFDELVFSSHHNGKDYFIIENNLFRDENQRYLYELRIGYGESFLYETALILLDKDGNIIEGTEAELNDVWSCGNWKIIRGCQFCCETNGVLLTSMENGEDTIYSTIRMDMEALQIDNELAYQQKDDTKHCYAKWSDTGININFCPVCGRRLRSRDEELIPYKGINLDLNH